MIFIDLDSFAPNDKWRLDAHWKTLEMSKLPTIQERKDFITNIWSIIKEEMLALPNANKCWFSESVETVSEYHVEHFRPKKEVIKFQVTIPNLVFQEKYRTDWIKENKNVGLGYWWLAFNYKNYRICGGIINSSYKRNFFPIKFDSYFIAEKHTDNYENEEIALLDPTKKNDPELLTFESDGKAIATYESDTDLWKYTRAVVSIFIYGLNDIDDLRIARKEKWEKCQRNIENANQIYNVISEVLIKGLDLDNEKEFIMFDALQRNLENQYNNIREDINPKSAFSAVAMACLKTYDYEWIKTEILNLS